jgi:hypothetical protein
MKRKIIWMALGILVGFPVAVVIFSAVEAAIMCNDWTGVQFIGVILWFVVVSTLVLALAKLPDKA